MTPPFDRPDLPEADVPRALAEDLAELFGESVPIAPEVDEAVLAAARSHLMRVAGPTRPRAWLRRAVALAAAAGLLAWVTLREPAVPGDVDESGRVDVLDAYRLALQLRAGTADERWDFDGDGRVDTRDVDQIMARAVRVGS